MPTTQRNKPKVSEWERVLALESASGLVRELAQESERVSAQVWAMVLA
jgi:hypothetical protein